MDVDDTANPWVQAPTEVKEYLRLHHAKQALASQVAVLNAQLRKINKDVIHQYLSQQQLQTLELYCTPEEHALYGAYGTLALHTTSRTLDIGVRKNLELMCTRFFTFLIPSATPESLKQLGEGQADWILTNRDKVEHTTLKRVYVERDQEILAQKKRAREIQAQEQKLHAASSSQLEEQPPPPRKQRRVSKSAGNPPETYVTDFRQLPIVQAIEQTLEHIAE